MRRCHRLEGRTARETPGYGSLADIEEMMAEFRRILRSMYDPPQDPQEEPKVTPATSDTHTDEEPVEDEPALLHVKSVDLAIPSNTRAHHTDEYDITDVLQNVRNVSRLVVRRGQPFDISVTFNRPYDKEKDDLRFVFRFGKRPIVSRGSHVEFILSEKDEPKEWGALILSKDGNSLRLKVMTPPTTLVGKWSLNIDVVKKDDTGVTVYRSEHPDPIYLLFNPWSKDDQVYMPEEGLRNEYILNETGKIYSGSKKRISPKPWNFGQFSVDILDCCLYLLDNSKMVDKLRSDPIQVSRKLSALANSSDDRGVLTGNWSGDYEGGTSPLAWSGSVDILNQYYKTKLPVQYGQCWVFSGVLTTLCRTLGIPARSVTNFASAHDTDASITIDSHFDAKGNPLDMYNDDSVWNFHVWNDVWMARPDLPKGYGGWQAIDATPQETSDSVYCMGPMSLLAIKRGEVNLPYDGRFVFAEVNADRVYWQQDADGAFKKIFTEESSVGKFLSTKRAQGIDREDVTDQYKFPDGSEEERAAIMRASVHSERTDIYEKGPKDVQFELIADANTMYGDTAKITLKVTNKSSSERQVNGRLVLSSMYYTGVHHKEVGRTEINDETVAPASTTEFDLVAPVDAYLAKTMDHCIFRMSCVCFVTETSQHFMEMEELRLGKPHLTIKAPEKADVGETIGVEVSFVNPLPVPLTKCELRVEGPGLQAPVKYKQKTVAATDTFVGTFEMTPGKKGDREIIVYFNCNHIQAITGSHWISVN